ncbi:hypothetical protein [Marinobacter salicampi]|uniref:hypothetical protein n=1 Tax=Marinobacter salicampi TaxID=435907 RepID=UPI00140A4FBA|nr:hypothetical protein [Marinobacter salicampi]
MSPLHPLGFLAASLFTVLALIGDSSAARGDALAETVSRGWQPPVELVGTGGDQARLAAERLRHYIWLQRLVMEHTEFHPQTQGFIDGLWASFERFDLDGLYRLLPEQDDQWRKLNIYGRSEAGQYLVGPEPIRGANGSNDRFRLGDLDARVQARRISAQNATHYLLDGSLELGLGPISWETVVGAGQEALHQVSASKQPPMGDYVWAGEAGAAARAMNPDLGDHELELISQLWVAYPELWSLLARLGQLETLFTSSASDEPYRKVRAAFRLDTARLGQRYPVLSQHLSMLDRLLKVKVEIHNEHGRLLILKGNTETLQVEVEMVVGINGAGQGEILPVANGRPRLDLEPFDPNRPRQLTAHIDTRMTILGVVARVGGMQTDIQYLPTASGAVFEGQVTEVPQVTVGGRALGLVPPSVINLFLPRRIDQLVTDFLTVASLGNGGEGIVGRLEIINGDPLRSGRLKAGGAFEGLDNFLVRIGMGIVNDRIIPDDRVSTELRQLVSDANEAFSRDLDLFERLALGPGRALSTASLNVIPGVTFID